MLLYIDLNYIFSYDPVYYCKAMEDLLDDELDHLQEFLQKAQRSAAWKAKANECQNTRITYLEFQLKEANSRILEHQLTVRRLTD